VHAIRLVEQTPVCGWYEYLPCRAGGGGGARAAALPVVFHRDSA